MVDRYIHAEPIGSADTKRTLRAAGTLTYSAVRYAEVGPTLEGRVESVKVDLGSVVKAEQVLAELSVPSVAAAQADYLRARASAETARLNSQREAVLAEQRISSTRDAELAASETHKAEADVAAAEARLRSLRVNVPREPATAAGRLALRAPIDGIVVERRVNRGQYLQPSDTAFVVADLSEVWAILEVYESDIRYLRVGEQAVVSVDALGGAQFTGTLALIEPALGSVSRVARARVVLPNADGFLRPNLFVRAEIALPSDHSASLLAPAAAVQPHGGQDAVFIEREPGLYELRLVKLAGRTSELAEIVEGLTRGDRVVVDGAFLLRGEVARQ